MNSWFHAKSSARKWGGKADDYLAVHTFIDSSKATLGDARHRAMYHHTLGVWLCQQIFGTYITVIGASGGEVQVPVRLIAERHIEEDLGRIPTPQDYLGDMPLKQWMSGPVRRTLPLSHVLGTRAMEEGEQA